MAPRKRAAAAADPADPRITKRRVTMQLYQALPPAKPGGEPRVATHTVVDYVRPDHLTAYVEHARTQYHHVEVSDEPDAGPGGYHGATHVPEFLSLPDAGTTYPATKEGE